MTINRTKTGPNYSNALAKEMSLKGIKDFIEYRVVKNKASIFVSDLLERYKRVFVAEGGEQEKADS